MGSPLESDSKPRFEGVERVDDPRHGGAIEDVADAVGCAVSERGPAPARRGPRDAGAMRRQGQSRFRHGVQAAEIAPHRVRPPFKLIAKTVESLSLPRKSGRMTGCR